MPARAFVNQEGSSNKFWSITVDGAEHTVHYGRIGTEGQLKTKAFADAAKAEASAEKLIAEKLAKGYVEDGSPPPRPAAAPPSVAAPPPAAPPSAAPPASAVPLSVAAPPPPPAAPPSAGPPAAAAPPASAVPSPAASPAPLRSGVTLRPDQWALAAWRPLPDAPGLPEPFDRARAASVLRRAKSIEYGSHWNWREAPFEGPLTAEEAGAWLRATAERRDYGPAAAAKALAADEAGPPTWSEALELSTRSMLPAGLALTALAALFEPVDLADWLLDGGVVSRSQSWRAEGRRLDLALGVRGFLLPRMDPAARERFATRVREALAATTWPLDHREYAPMPFLLAAQLGFHDELQRVVDSWPEDFYSGEAWSQHYQRPQAVVFGLGGPDAVREAFERLRLAINLDWHVAGWLAHTELSSLDVAADRIAKLTNRDEAESVLRVLTQVHDPAAAPAMLELMRASKAPALAREWLAEHPLEALTGLAATLEARPRPEVVEYLRARNRAGDDVAAALPQLTEHAAARFRELVVDHVDRASRALTRDELPAELLTALDAAPKKKLPAWIDVPALPPIVLGEEGRLDDDAVGALLRLLAAGEPSPIAEAEAFGWALFEAWLAEGAPPRDKWAMLALGELGADATATRLAPMIRAWPGESQHQRAVLGLGVLAAIGTDTALMLLSGIAERVKFKALQNRAREAMDEIATSRGMTKAELEDRIVPDCGLDERGSRTFDFGPRQFLFVLGPGMKPMVRDESGKVRASPPKPGAKDDEILAARAVEDWKLLRKQVGDVAKIQAARLEQAMVTQRRWSAEDFERFIVRHPLQRHLARLLVWRAGEQTFRVTEELDYADAADEPVTLTGEVGVVHPLQLSEDERAAWGEQLADYEIVPPFAQLGRPVVDVEDRERRERILTRFARRKVAASTLVRMLENQGWQRGAAFDNGIFMLHAKAFPSLGVTAVVQYEGIPMGYMVDWEDQSLEQVYVIDEAVRSAHELGWGAYDGAKLRMRKWGDVDPIVRSEVLADLATILEKAR